MPVKATFEQIGEREQLPFFISKILLVYEMIYFV